MSHRLSWFALAALCAVFLGHASIYYDWIEDDAFISLRYAANADAGEGLVFNQGEKVEGYSNFSWVVLGWMVMKAGLDPVTSVKTLGILFGLLCLPLAWQVARRFLGGNPWAALAAPAILAVAPPPARHAVNGLETLLFAFLLLLTVWLLTIRPAWPRDLGLVGVLVLLSLTRPEGFAVAFLVLAAFFPGRIGMWFRPGEERSRWWIIGGFLVLWGSYMAWRWSYYGSIFPNTYYAKMTGEAAGIVDGFQYAVDFLRDCLLPVPILLAAVPLVIGFSRPVYRHMVFLLVAYAGFVVVAGGDWMLVYRMFVPVLPLLATGAAVGLGDLWSRWGGAKHAEERRLGFVAFGLVAILSTLGTIQYERAVWREVAPSLEQGGYLAHAYRDLGIWLGENTPVGSSVAVSDIGAIGYYSGRPIIDMFGLVDRHIARQPGKQHHKTDPAYVLGREPDYVVLVRDADRVDGYLRLPDRRLAGQEEFVRSYRLERTFPMPGSGEIIELFARK